MSAPVTICDPGLIGLASHNFNYVDQIAGQLRRLGHAPRVFGFVKARPVVRERLGAEAHFTHTLYAARPTAGADEAAAQLRALNQSFAADMARLPAECVGAGALVLLPAITQHQIEGLADWLTAIPAEHRPKVVVQLMFAPTWLPGGGTCPCGEAAYARAFARLAPLIGRSVFLCTETEAVAQAHARLGATGLRLLAVPTPEAEIPRRPAGRGAVPRIAVLGFSKREKGFHRVGGIMRACRRRGLELRWLVQSLHFGDDPEIVAAEADILAQDNVHLVRGAIERGHLLHLIAAADVVLLPYDPDQYAGRGSSLFSECVSLAAPCLVPAGTAMAEAAAKGEAEAAIYPHDDDPACAAALEALLADTDAPARAQERARLWRRHHSPASYCRTVLELAGMPVPAVTAVGAPPPSRPSIHDLHPYPPLALGQNLLMHCASPALCDGWADDAPGGVRIAAGEAVIALRAQGDGTVLRLEMQAEAAPPTGLHARWNGRDLGPATPTPDGRGASWPVPAAAWWHDVPVVLRLRVAGDSPRLVALRVETLS